MSRVDAIVIILMCAVISFVLGMAIPEPAGQIGNGLLWAIIGTGIGTIACVIFIRIISSTRRGKDA